MREKRAASSRRALALAVCIGSPAVCIGNLTCIGEPVDPELTDAQQQVLAHYVKDREPRPIVHHAAAFGDPHVELAGYMLSPRTLTQLAGTSFRITFVWRVHQPVPGRYRLFTHLTDDRGRMLENLDGRRGLRAIPPSNWPAAKFILDAVDISIPADAPERIQLHVGFFRGRNRLAARGGGVDETRGAAVIQLAVTGGGARDIPELSVPRLAKGATIQIDGVTDEPAWQHAARTGAFVNVATGARATSSPIQGSARILWDAANLFVAFEVGDRDLRGGFDEHARDPHLWTRDTVEIMIDPDGDGDNKDYYEIQIGPQNLVFDSRFDDYNQPRGGPTGPFGHQHWSANARSAVRLSGSLDDSEDVDGGYLVEVRIPFSAFDMAQRTPPAPGDVWRANFYAMENNGGVAWSPILGEGNFHRASRFGRLIWSERQVP